MIGVQRETISPRISHRFLHGRASKCQSVIADSAELPPRITLADPGWRAFYESSYLMRANLDVRSSGAFGEKSRLGAKP